MPAKSKSQFRFMQAVLHSANPPAKGPSKAVAKEFIDATGSPKNLPEKVKSKKPKRAPSQIGLKY